MSGTLFIVATPIGNLEDITLRALRVLREVSLIAAEDTRRTHHLLARYAITTRTTSLHEHNEALKTASLIERLKNGEHIALVSDAGTPTVSDPGYRLVRAALDAQLRVEPIPGPSAILTALVASGVAADSFTFLGFPPARSKARSDWLNNLSSANRTVVFYESPHRLLRTLSDLQKYLGDVPIVVARELTKIHEEFVRDTMSSVISRFQEPVGEFTLILEIGQKTNIEPAQEGLAPPPPATLLQEFSVLTEADSLPRRVAIKRLADRYHLSSRDVYQAVERARKSVE